ncbi:MAG TPA: FkbM family methyltransferase [Candidatus Acidoferrales bacterium]|nr:FkbM family methyltransferase [Candidatus Acidoferrales bacterium]
MTPSAKFLKNFVRRSVPRPLRNWLRSPSKSIEWIWDSARFSFGVTKTIQFLPEVPIRLHPHAFKVVCRSQLADSEQNAEFQNFLSCCHSKMVLFDIGAHYGLFSLAAARRGGRAVAVDPSAIAVRMIARHVELNRVQPQVRILQAAVSDTDGELRMLSSGVFSEGYARLVRGRPSSELTKVHATTVDCMTSEFGAPTHIKIDVEGHEAAALGGGRETLRRFSPELFLELHTEMVAADGGNPNAALDELDRLGYETFALDGSPIDRRTILEKSIIRIVARRA